MRDESRQRLEQFREALLKLHKTLITSERVTYEATVGRIESPYHFLRLVTGDPWFAWLQPFSQLIVSIDEAVDADEPITDAQADAFRKEARRLLVASESGDGFAHHYFEALQRDPDVVLTHGEVMTLLREGQRGSES